MSRKKDFYRKIKYAQIGEKEDMIFTKYLYQTLLNSNLYRLTVSDENLSHILTKRRFQGLRVGNPYKEKVIEFLDNITDQAREIGEVDLIHNYKGKLYGFNTVHFGIISLINKYKISVSGKKIAVLTKNEVSKSLIFALKSMKVGEIEIINYEDLEFYSSDAQIIFNTIDFDKEEYKLNLENYKNLSYVIDLIFEPYFSRLIIDAKDKGINTINGIYAELYQEKKAIEIINRVRYENSQFDDILDNYLKSKLNIILVGMPGAGKTTIGRKISKIMNRHHVDLDKEFQMEYDISPAQFLRNSSEKEFRRKESMVVRSFSQFRGKVISTSGGVVQLFENYYYLKKNSFIFRVDRDLRKLSTYNRPLSEGGIETLIKMSKERKEKYDYFTDYIVKNTGDFDDSAIQVVKRFMNIEM